jgi:AGZA family xanthine/uracil permease-like MFS transporter
MAGRDLRGRAPLDRIPGGAQDEGCPLHRHPGDALAVFVNEVFAGGKAWSHLGPRVARLPISILDLPAASNFALLGDFSFGFVARMGALAAVLAVFTIMLADFFDTMGTVVGLGSEAGFVDEQGRLPRLRRVLLVDSLGAVLGGAASASSNTTYIESAAGISEGGRTGLTSMVVSLLFLASVFAWPLADVIPPQATAPALVIVGFLMMGLAREIPWNDHEVALPAFLTMAVMPFTFSITNGIGAGFISYTVIKLLRGKAGEVHPMMLVSALAFLVYFSIAYVRTAFGVS